MDSSSSIPETSQPSTTRSTTSSQTMDSQSSTTSTTSSSTSTSSTSTSSSSSRTSTSSTTISSTTSSAQATTSSTSTSRSTTSRAPVPVTTSSTTSSPVTTTSSLTPTSSTPVSSSTSSLIPIETSSSSILTSVTTTEAAPTSAPPVPSSVSYSSRSSTSITYPRYTYTPQSTEEPLPAASSASDNNSNKGLAVGLGVGLGVFFLLLVLGLSWYFFLYKPKKQDGILSDVPNGVTHDDIEAGAALQSTGPEMASVDATSATSAAAIAGAAGGIAAGAAFGAAAAAGRNDSMNSNVESRRSLYGTYPDGSAWAVPNSSDNLLGSTSIPNSSMDDLNEIVHNTNTLWVDGSDAAGMPITDNIVGGIVPSAAANPNEPPVAYSAVEPIIVPTEKGPQSYAALFGEPAVTGAEVSEAHRSPSQNTVIPEGEASTAAPVEYQIPPVLNATQIDALENNSWSAAYPHTPQNNDEILVNTGDSCHILKAYADGWAFGTNESTGAKGVFPVLILSTTV